MGDISPGKGFAEFLSGSPDLIKRVATGITAFTGFVTGLVSFINVFQGNTGFITLALLVLGIAILWGSFIHIYWGKSSTQQSIGFLQNKQRREPLYSRTARGSALIGIVAIPVLAIVTFILVRYIQTLPSDKIIIAIADFRGPDSENFVVTETLIEQLREATRDYPEIRIQPLARAITAQEGSETARKAGAKQKAAIVVWGWYGKTQERARLTVHFELLKKNDHLPLENEKQITNSALSELESFHTQIELSSQMSYLTLLVVGLIRYEVHDYDGAIDRFTKAIDQGSIPEQIINPGWPYFYRGNAFGLKKDNTLAIGDYCKAIQLNPDLAEAYNNRGFFYASEGTLDQAIRDFSKALSLSSNYIDAHYNLGLAYANKGEFDKAIESFERAISLNPRNASLYTDRGLARAMSGDHDGAISDYAKAIDVDPKFIRAYNNRGLAYASLGSFDLAIADYGQALHLKSDYADALNNLAQTYVEKGDEAKAVAMFERAIDLSPSDAQLYFNRGTYYLVRNDYNRAILDFDKAINLREDYIKAYANRGYAYSKVGDFTRAIEDLSKAIHLKPDYKEAYNSRAVALAEKGDYDQAISDFHLILSMSPSDLQTYYNLGNLYCRKGNKEQAITCFKKALGDSADESEIQRIVEQRISEFKTR